MRHYKATVVLLCIIGCVVSCKKKSSTNSFSTLKIATIDYAHSGAIKHYSFFYDAFNDVDSISSIGDGTAAGTNQSYTLNYFGSSFSVTDDNHNTYKVYANTAGWILEVLTPDTLIMRYEPNNITELGELDTKSPTSIYPYSLTTSIFYNWTNGDVISFGPSGSATGGYYYDMSRSGQPGDPLRVDDFINYGRSYIRSAHLPKGMLNSGDTLSRYFYQFNPLGQISLLTVVTDLSGLSDTTTYSYRYY